MCVCVVVRERERMTVSVCVRELDKCKQGDCISMVMEWPDGGLTAVDQASSQNWVCSLQ